VPVRVAQTAECESERRELWVVASTHIKFDSECCLCGKIDYRQLVPIAANRRQSPPIAANRRGQHGESPFGRHQPPAETSKIAAESPPNRRLNRRKIAAGVRLLLLLLLLFGISSR
jgi:hypothetical protein